MMDSPYLKRATDLDGMAVNVTTTLIQSLTLIHGGALVAAPAFAEQFKPILQSPYLVLMFGFFATGLVLAIFAGIFAFYALSRRSDENLELWNSGGSINPAVENRFMKFVESRFPATKEYDGTKLFTLENGKRLATPLFFVIIALGTTDLLFALDSIPAIYGLTDEPYIVLTANLFALMGLRQLYFLIGDLLQRLVYLSYGLAFLLLFIGVKLILHAMHENTLPFINGGEPIHWAPEIPIWVSLVVIVGTLAVTTVLSLAADRRRAVA